MSQLPPDPARLRVILAHLERQIAENETVGLYLRLQRDAVVAALADLDRLPRGRSRRVAKGGGSLPGFVPPPVQTGYVVQRERTPSEPAPALIHVADCGLVVGACRPIRADEARAALTDSTVEPCPSCRPDTELGIDVA
ncbi:DUF6233 domain-containing protein [Streptomyces brasiliensis]|nr:DUF6233 domain-containing protein [Streptomyces brasiliensis]